MCKTLIFFLFCANVVFAQVPINSHRTIFQYSFEKKIYPNNPEESDIQEGFMYYCVTFSDSIAKHIIQKHISQFAKIPNKVSYEQSLIDTHSFEKRNDSLYWHIYSFSRWDGNYWYPPSIKLNTLNYFSAHRASLFDHRDDPLFVKIIAIYKQTLKKKKASLPK